MEFYDTALAGKHFMQSKLILYGVHFRADKLEVTIRLTLLLIVEQLKVRDLPCVSVFKAIERNFRY